MRTPLTYYGGKQQLARHIVRAMPAHRVYVEPFAGGAAVLFAKPRAERETLNDLDGQIMRFWRVLRDQPESLAAAVAATPYGRREWIESAVAAEDDVESARRLMVNVDQSFSRSRRSWSRPCIGDGRGRWQPGTWANLPAKILAAAERLTGVCLEQCDALELIARCDRTDALIYCDPPYAGQHRLSVKERYNVEAPDIMTALVPVLAGVRHACVLLSGYPCAEADSLGWASVRLPRKRTVRARDGAALLDAPETLWSNQPLHMSGPLFREVGPVCSGEREE